MKSAIRRAMVASGVDRLVRAVAGGPGAILTFHQVSEGEQPASGPANAGLSIAAPVLESFIATLKAEGYSLVTVSEAFAMLRDGADRRFAAITFDDGYRDNHAVLLPLLERLGAKATVFVSTGFIDRDVAMWWYGVEQALAENERVTIRCREGAVYFPSTTPAERAQSYGRIALRFLGFDPVQTRRATDGLARDHGIDCLAITDRVAMSWDMVRALHESGRVEIGAHTISHSPLAAMDESAARHEIAGGGRRIAEKLGCAPRSFAYPYGSPLAVSARDIALAAEAGYLAAVTTESRPLSARDAAQPHALPRIGLGGCDDEVVLRFRLSGLGRGRVSYAG